MHLKTCLSALFLIAFSWLGYAQEGPANNEEEFEKQYQQRIKMEKLNGVYIPKNLEDALLQLEKLTTTEAKAKIKALPEDSVCMRMHGRLGQWMIMNWGFYGGSRLSHYLRSAGVTFPDDMADFLILGFHRKLNGKVVGIKELAVRFKERRKAEHEKEMKSRKVVKEERRPKQKE